MEAALQLAVCARMILTAQGHLSTAGGRKVYLSIASTSGGHPSDSAEMALVYLNCVPNPRHGTMINKKNLLIAREHSWWSGRNLLIASTSGGHPSNSAEMAFLYLNRLPKHGNHQQHLTAKCVVSVNNVMHAHTCIHINICANSCANAQLPVPSQ